MTDLLEEIEADSQGRHVGCSVGIFLSEQPDPQKWLTAFADKQRYATTAIHRAMSKRGYSRSAKQVESHRNGGCSCAGRS
jgi:hypothetical protein